MQKKFIQWGFSLLMILLITGQAQAQRMDSARKAKIMQDSIDLANTAKLRDTLSQPVVDTSLIINSIQPDSSVKAKVKLNPKGEHDPGKAAFYSAVLPGMGQAYNREYWKIPIVYAALGISAGFFISNLDNYKLYRDAYRMRIANQGNPNYTDDFKYTNSDLVYLRDAYRQYVDYSVLVFALAYGLNIVDATVFAHLKQFDISDDLSMYITPKIINNQAIGIGINLQIGNKRGRKYNRGGFASLRF